MTFFKLLGYRYHLFFVSYFLPNNIVSFAFIHMERTKKIMVYNRKIVYIMLLIFRILFFLFVTAVRAFVILLLNFMVLWALYYAGFTKTGFRMFRKERKLCPFKQYLKTYTLVLKNRYAKCNFLSEYLNTENKIIVAKPNMP